MSFTRRKWTGFAKKRQSIARTKLRFQVHEKGFPKIRRHYVSCLSNGDEIDVEVPQGESKHGNPSSVRLVRRLEQEMRSIPLSTRKKLIRKK